MRLSVLSAFATLSVVTLACDGKPLTGPEAQAAYAKATSHYATVPGTAVVFIDGQRMPAGQRQDQVDPQTIDRIEILSGAAAANLVGDEGRNGVIRIYTKPGSEAGPPRAR